MNNIKMFSWTDFRPIFVAGWLASVAGYNLLAGQPNRSAGLTGIYVRIGNRPRVGPVNRRPPAKLLDGTRRRQPFTWRRPAPSTPASTPGPCRLRDRGIYRPGHVDQLRSWPTQWLQRPRTTGRHDDNLRHGQVILQQVLIIIIKYNINTVNKCSVKIVGKKSRTA